MFLVILSLLGNLFLAPPTFTNATAPAPSPFTNTPPAATTLR